MAFNSNNDEKTRYHSSQMVMKHTKCLLERNGKKMKNIRIS